MARFDFCGGSYTVQTLNADAQRSLNLYPEANESGAGRSKMILLGTPGLKSIISSLSGAPRGQLEYNGRLFVVAGANLYEIILTSLGPPIAVTANNLGTVANDGLPASLAANETQLLIASGGSVYLLTLATNGFVQVAASNFTLPTGNAPVIQVAFCSSFFLALMANSQTIGISNVLDGSQWTINGQIVVSKFPDNVVGMIVDHDQLWVRGRKASVAYFASGSLNVFDFVPGSLIQQGGAAPFAAATLDNSVFWVGGDERGDSIAWRANGYTPVRVSTHAVELAWQSYPKRSDAVSYSYQEQGHAFWVTLFPSANRGNGATWVYDTATGLWHERDLLNQTSGASMGHPSWNHSFWNGAHIVGDWRSSNLYQMSLGFFDNNGVPLQRVRRAPHISTELETLRHSRFELDMETGVAGQIPVTTAAPSVITLADSGGQLWSVSVIDSGNLTSAKIGFGTAQTVILNDPTNATTWKLGITTLGLLTTTSQALTVNPTFLAENSASFNWNIQVTAAGLLQTVKQGIITRAPLVFLRWSDDGGHTWSSEYSRPANDVGIFKPRIVWRRLGRARIRTYEVSCSEPIPVRFIDAYVNALPGYQPSERLIKQYAKVG